MVSMQRITLFGWNICNGINTEDDRVQMCTSTRQRRLQVTDRHEVYREGRAPEEDNRSAFMLVLPSEFDVVVGSVYLSAAFVFFWQFDTQQ